jgi:SAM-dependent methyltransferase
MQKELKQKKAHGIDGVKKLIEVLGNDSFITILDIGAGKEQEHANYMRDKGLNVTTIDFFNNADIIGNYNEIKLQYQFDAIHASHVLEHQLNTHDFLRKINSDLKEGGWLCLTVPPLKHKIVGGHVSLWNAGLILYHLVLAGFDCREAKIKEYGYNISVIVKKKRIQKIPKLVYDSPDMDYIKKYIPPFQFNNRINTFNGDIKEHNW